MTEATDPEPQITQKIAAVSGFAYGVIGADIHVLAGGAPLYLLANWQPAPTVSPGWLWEMPGRILNERRPTTPLTCGGLAQLEIWRGSAARLAVRWLYGPGTLDRVSLSNKFAADSAAAGWKVISAFHGPDAEPISPGSQDVRTAGSAGLLLIVDQADRWLLANLTWLLKSSVLHQVSIVTRVLMIGRTADGWPRVRAILDTYQAHTSSQHLPGLGQASGESSSMSAAEPENRGAISGSPPPQ